MSIDILDQPWVDDAKHRFLERELRSGFEYIKATEEMREALAAKEAAQYKGAKSIDGLGLHVAEIPQKEYYFLIQKYGYDTVHSRDFIRSLHKYMPHLKSNSV